MSASLHSMNALGAGARRNGVVSWLGHALPTVFVLAALASLAYWGHHSGWTLPKFSTLMGKDQAKKDDWCAAHSVPESQCVECNPDLLPVVKPYGWCKKHGVPNCPLEHPDVAQLPYPPKVETADLERAARALALMPRPQNNSKCKLHQRRIQFASAEAFARAGIEVEPVWRAEMSEYVHANGEVTYDPTRVARLSSRAAGAVWRVDKKVGDRVKAGETVVLIEAREVGRAKSELLQAIAQVRLKARTMDSLRGAGGAVAEQRVREGEAELSDARIRLLSAQQTLINLGLPVDAGAFTDLAETQIAARLQFLGLADELRQTLDPKTTTANLLPVKAPLDGEVVEREVVAGEVVDTSKVLLIVADARRMGLTLHVGHEDARRLALGQPVRFSDGAEEVRGVLNWMSTSVDEKTRTVKVRAELDNAAGRLRANTFGSGRIVLREEKDAIVVPNEAVHWEGDCFIVFVRDKHFLDDNGFKVFHTRTIRPGAKDDKYTEIVAGVLPGEVVAAKGSGVLRAELLKNKLGEG
jgi:cobalt-zinc-cadmium efflux system membrane fusion protein